MVSSVLILNFVANVMESCLTAMEVVLICMKALKQLLGQAFNFTPVTLSCYCTMLWTLLHEMVELMEGVPVYMSLFLL